MIGHLLLQSSLFSQEQAPWLIIGAGVFLITYIIIRPFMRRKKDPFDKPAFGRSLSQQRTVERQMESLLVELTEMTRQMSAQLDTRSAKLEHLLEEADRKILELKRASEGSVLERVPIDTPYPSPAPPIAHTPNPDHVPVYHLADAGKSIAQIAAELSRPSGEIELILALRQR
jgi:hypothetical protein